MSYPNIIRAVTSTLNDIHLASVQAKDPAQLESITAEIIQRQQSMPDYMRFPLRLLTQCFDLCGLIYGSRRFCNLPAARQRQQILSWKQSRIGVCSSLIRFYESLFLLIALQESSA